MKKRNTLLLSLSLFLCLGFFLFFNKGEISKFVGSVRGDESGPTLNIFANFYSDELGNVFPDLLDTLTTNPLILYANGTPINLEFENNDSGRIYSYTPLEVGVEYDFGEIPTTDRLNPSLDCYSNAGEITAFPFVLDEEDDEVSCYLSYEITPPTLNVEFELIPDRTDHSYVGLSAGEAMELSGLKLLGGGETVNSNFIEYGDYYSYIMFFLQTGIEYNFTELAELPGYEPALINCENQDSGETIPLPFTTLGDSRIYCHIEYEEKQASYIDVEKIVLDGNGNPLEEELDEIFTAQLTNLTENKVYTDTMENSDWNLASFKTYDLSAEHVLTEVEKDGYAFLGCTEFSEITVSREEDYTLPPLHKELRFKIEDMEHGGWLYTTCYNQIIEESLLNVEKTNNSLKTGIKPNSNVTFMLTVTAPSDGKDGNFIAKNVVVHDKTAEGITYKAGSWNVTSSKRGVLDIPEPTYDGTNWALWRLGDMVEGEVITLEYVGETSPDIQPGIYEDQAFVLGASIMGEQVLGNVSTGSDTEFVGTEIKILGETDEEQPEEEKKEEVKETGATLPKTGASSYIAILGTLLSTLGLGVVLKKEEKE